MNIGLINGDKSTFPNLALMKISAYHKEKGDNVELANIFGKYDKCYASRVFSFSTENNDLIDLFQPECGGTGFNVEKKLDPEIDAIKEPDYSIYPNSNFSIQYYSRGCIRNCPFCLVREKEGIIQPCEPMALNPKGEYIEVLDNNFFANKEWKFAVEDLMKTKQPISLNGVDVRIITDEQAFTLSKLKLKKKIHIAWDDVNTNVLDGIETLIKHVKPYKIMCYILVGFNSTIEEDLYRINKINEYGITPFVMPYRDIENNKEPSLYAKDIARWCNMQAVRKSCKFEDYEPRRGFKCKSYFNVKL